MAQPILLSLHCVQCEEGITLVVAPSHDTEPHSAQWLCPLCDQPHAARIPGHITEVRVDGSEETFEREAS